MIVIYRSVFEGAGGDYNVCLRDPPGALRCVEARAEVLLGRGSGVLYGGPDLHLHVPVQQRLRNAPAHHRNVGGGVRLTILLKVQL